MVFAHVADIRPAFADSLVAYAVAPRIACVGTLPRMVRGGGSAGMERRIGEGRPRLLSGLLRFGRRCGDEWEGHRCVFQAGMVDLGWLDRLCRSGLVGNPPSGQSNELAAVGVSSDVASGDCGSACIDCAGGEAAGGADRAKPELRVFA